MEKAGMFLICMLSCTAAVSIEGIYSTRIITEPSQGPFRLEQQVLFSCQIEPAPPEPVTYQWRFVEDPYGGSTTQQNFTRHYYERHLHYCYYYCAVSVNGTLLGSASRIVEVQGLLYTEELVVRSFDRGGSLVLNINMSDDYLARYISSIAWYHNGTEIVSGSKYGIRNNSTMLTIHNMVESDAGTYEVKIASISYVYGFNDSPDCDSLVLPLLESLAAHAPVTFTVQEQHVPVYDPASIVSTHYITDNSDDNTMELTRAVEFSLSPLESVSSYWYRNGTQIANQGEFSLQLAYNNTATIIGDYVRILSSRLYRSDLLRFLCRDYYYYYDDNYLFSSMVPHQVSFWSIKLYRSPSSVDLHFEERILTGLDTTTVECTAVGGEPEEALNLTLWRNGELLEHVNGSYLSHMTTPYQYGTYQCSVDSLYNTSVLLERVSFQLLLDTTSSTQCKQNQHVEDLKTGVSDILGDLCQSCDDVYPSDIVDVELNCSASRRFAYLTAGLVYSTPDGDITASTLITRLHTWLLSEDTPSILVDGTPVGLSKQCPTQLNAIARSSCTELFISNDLVEATSPKSSPQFVVGFFAGLGAGVLITALVIALILCVIKLRSSGRRLPPKTDKSSDIPMAVNEAYGHVAVDARYQASYEFVDAHCQADVRTDETIYELPAV